MIQQFHLPNTVQQAIDLKKSLGGRAVYLAGGTFLNSMESPLHPGHYISLAGLKLDRIAAKNGVTTIGALCTIQQLIEDRRVPQPLKAAAAQFTSRNIRNMATIGGSIARNKSCSDLLPMLVALEATVRLSGSPAGKEILVQQYLRGTKEGLIMRIVIPKVPRNRALACCNFRTSAGARAVLTAAVALTVRKGIIADPIIALGGVDRTVVRLATVEARLDGGRLPEPRELESLISRGLVRTTCPGCAAPCPRDGVSAEFRRYQAGVMVALSLQEAFHSKAARPRASEAAGAGPR